MVRNPGQKLPSISVTSTSALNLDLNLPFSSIGYLLLKAFQAPFTHCRNITPRRCLVGRYVRMIAALCRSGLSTKLKFMLLCYTLRARLNEADMMVWTAPFPAPEWHGVVVGIDRI